MQPNMLGISSGGVQVQWKDRKLATRKNHFRVRKVKVVGMIISLKGVALQDRRPYTKQKNTSGTWDSKTNTEPILPEKP